MSHDPFSICFLSMSTGWRFNVLLISLTTHVAGRREVHVPAPAAAYVAPAAVDVCIAGLHPHVSWNSSRLRQSTSRLWPAVYAAPAPVDEYKAAAPAALLRQWWSTSHQQCLTCYCSCRGVRVSFVAPGPVDEYITPAPLRGATPRGTHLACASKVRSTSNCHGVLGSTSHSVSGCSCARG